MSAPRLSTLPPLAGHTRRVSSVALTGDGQHILSASLDRTLRLWSVATVLALAVSGDGRRAAAGTYDRKVLALDLEGPA